MSMSANLHNPIIATSGIGGSCEWVEVKDIDGNSFTIFLPAGTAQSVADAINAAVKEGKGAAQ